MSQTAVVLDPIAAIDRLQAADRNEAFSALIGEPALVVDLAGSGHSTADRIAAACTALRQLACPTIGLGKPDCEAACALAPHLDTTVTDREAADDLLSAIVRTPQASTALVQLLRLGESLDVHGALIAESLVYSTLQSGPEFATWLQCHEQRSVASPNPEPAVLTFREDARLRLILNRPERHNAFSVALRDALVEGLSLAVADPSLTDIKLSGAGPTFSSGGDLAEFGTLPDPSTAHAVRSARNPGRLLAAISDRVRVEVHGACVGAGIELPAFAARVVAHPDATFALPEVSMGLIPGAGGTASIPRRIGRQKTAWLALSGSKIDAGTALDWGLVDAIGEFQ